MKKNRPIVVVCAVVVCLGAILSTMVRTDRALRKVSYSQFLAQVEAGKIAGVVISERSSGVSQATYTRKDGGVERTILPPDYRAAMRAMQDQAVNIEIEESSRGLLAVLINASPFLLLLGFWVFMMWQMRNGRFAGWPKT